MRETDSRKLEIQHETRNIQRQRETSNIKKQPSNYRRHQQSAEAVHMVNRTNSHVSRVHIMKGAADSETKSRRQEKKKKNYDANKALLLLKATQTGAITSSLQTFKLPL